MSFVLAFHVVGAAMWLIGAMIVTRLLKIYLEPNAASTALTSAIRIIFFGFVVAGLALSLCSGMLQLLSYRGADSLVIYMKQGWFHAKLTLVLVMLIVTAVIWQGVNKIARGEVVSRARLTLLHILCGTSLLAIVTLTLVGRGY